MAGNDAFARAAAEMNGENMVTLRIQHSVPTFDAWKQAFDADPIDRRGSGVRRHNVYRSVRDPRFVMIDLEFETVIEAEAFLGS